MDSRDNKPSLKVSAAAHPGPSWQECVELLESLPTLGRGERVAALDQLVRNPSPGIRSRALHMGAALLSDDTLTSYLRNGDDDVLRNAGLEMLKMRGGRGFGLAVQLLSDSDDDVALQAVLVLDHLKDPRALEPLRAQLQHSDTNVQQGVILAMGRLGDARAIRDLLPFLSADTWLQLAAVEALGDIRSPAAVGALGKLLTDLMVGPIVGEALARIGGVHAFRKLAEHWVRFEAELDPDTSLGLLAHVLEGLRRTPTPPAGFRESLETQVREGESVVQYAAARCLLSLTGGSNEEQLLEILVKRQREAQLLPTCLIRRSDLIPQLLSCEDHRKAWGFLLCERYSKEVPPASLGSALRGPLEEDWFGLVVLATRQVRKPEVANALLDLYSRLPMAGRSTLAPALQAHRKDLKSLVHKRSDLGDSTRLVLRARLGEVSKDMLHQIAALEQPVLLETLAELSDYPAVLRRLPWRTWVQDSPATYAPLAVEAAVEGGLRELIPALRRQLQEGPSPELIRAMGDLGDRESVPILVAHLDAKESPFAAVILESLGRIGGPEVRRVLRQAAEGTDEDRARIAYRGLSLCATEEDDEFFRAAVVHPDWYVRLASVEVLGRFQRPDNLAALAQLAADPSPLVAQRALAFLEPAGGSK